MKTFKMELKGKDYKIEVGKGIATDNKGNVLDLYSLKRLEVLHIIKEWRRKK